jgi:hypothetical protein
MQRLKDSQDALTVIYEKYNQVTSQPLAPLDINDPESLNKLLNTVMNRESISHIQKKKALKESIELRTLLADVLLLLDNCDIKEIKANMKKAAEIENAE